MATFTGDAIGSPQLAASLMALGIAPLKGKFIIRVGDVPADQAILYRFEGHSDCGKFETRQCIFEWRRGTFPAASQHPLHAMARMWQAYQANGHAMRRPLIHGVPKGVFTTDDKLKASALEALGHSVHMPMPISKHGDRACWHFADNPHIQHDAAAFGDRAFIAKHPDALLSYLSASAINWRRLVDNIKTADPFAVVKHQGKHIAVGAKSSQQTQDRFGQLLEGKWRV